MRCWITESSLDIILRIQGWFYRSVFWPLLTTCIHTSVQLLITSSLCLHSIPRTASCLLLSLTGYVVIMSLICFLIFIIHFTYLFLILCIYYYSVFLVMVYQQYCCYFISFTSYIWSYLFCYLFSSRFV